MAHLSDHAALLGRSAAGPAGLVFCVLFRLLIGYRHEAVVHPDRRCAVVGKSAETRSVLPALQERVVLGCFLAGAIAAPARYQGRADDQGAIALGHSRLGTCAALREGGEGARYQHSGHHYAQALRNCPSLPGCGSPFRATIVALAGAQLLPQMSNFAVTCSLLSVANFKDLRQGTVHAHGSTTSSPRSGGPTPRRAHNTFERYHRSLMYT